jgi:hypothetical protein
MQDRGTDARAAEVEPHASIGLRRGSGEIGIQPRAHVTGGRGTAETRRIEPGDDAVYAVTGRLPAQPGAAVEGESASVDGGGEVGCDQVAPAPRLNVQLELAVRGNGWAQSGEIGQRQRSSGQLDVEAVDHPRILERPWQDEVARDLARLAREANWVEPDLIVRQLPAGGEREPATAARRLHRKLQAVNRRQRSLAEAKVPYGQLLSRAWATESGASSAATATSRTSIRSIANPPPPVVSDDFA